MKKQERFCDAVKSWQKALDIALVVDSDHASILYNKALACENLGFLYLARKSYKEVLKKEPDHIEAKKQFKAYQKIQKNYKLETMQSSVQQFVMLEGLQNRETKVRILKEIEKIEYGTLVKQYAYKEAAEEVKTLVIILNGLGYLTTKMGDLSCTKEGELNVKLRYYTDAAVFYQYVITILDEKLIKINPEDKNAFLIQQQINPRKSLSHLQELMFSAIGVKGVKEPFDKQEDNNKQSLNTIRNEIYRKLQEAESFRKRTINNLEEKQKHQASYVEEVHSLFKLIADDMQKFLDELYGDSEQEIGTPPCKYAIIGLGSMAMRQMTPYSDLEFAILTENEDYKQSKDPKKKEYFKNLSHLVNFKVINLGESVHPTSKYGVDLSHLIHRGVSFDLGGKTPLGRDDKKYELVQTIDGMLKYVLNEKNEAEKIDKNLPYILENVCYVHGDKQLVTSYKEEVKKVLTSKSESDKQGRLNCEIRALKLLQKGTVELSYLQQTTVSTNTSYLQPTPKVKESRFGGDLSKLAPDLGIENDGRLFDVKQEIYRLPDRLIYNFGLYYGIKEDSNWDIVDKLKDQKIITPEAAFNLRNALTFATTLRLKTYFYHGAQKEDMSIFSKPVATESESKEEAKQIFHLTDEDGLEEEGYLFQYFYTALPLHESLEAFCSSYKRLSKAEMKTFFQGSDFYVDDHANKGQIYYRLTDYENAQSHIEKALKEQNNPNKLKLQSILGIIYYRKADYVKASKYFEECLDNFKLNDQEKPHRYIAGTKINLGSTFYRLGEYDQAIKNFDESLDMLKKIFTEDPHPEVARTLKSLGCAYSEKGQYDEAIKYYNKSLKMNKKIYEKDAHPDVAGCLNNLGGACIEIGQYDEGIKYYKDSLKMKKQIYKEEPHLDVAYTLNNLGVAYREKGQYDKAICYFERSLKMKKKIHKEIPHPDIALSFHNLGCTYNMKGEHDQAIKYYMESLDMFEQTFKEKLHPYVARALNSLGSAYREKGQYDDAISYIKRSLEMNKKIYKEEPHADVASSLHNLGCVYVKKGKYEKAIKIFDKTLDMFEQIFKKKPHPSVAGTLSCLGATYRMKGQYNEAIKYYEESLNIYKQVFKENPHSDVAGTLNNLGEAYRMIGQNDKATSYIKRSLEMNKKIYKEEPHADVASSLHNLGCVYVMKGKYEKAIKIFDKTLDMFEQIFKKKPHPSVAGTLTCLGAAYRMKGQYNEAIKYYEESLNIFKQVFKENPHSDVAATLHNLGEAYRMIGQNDKATSYIKRSLKMNKQIQKKSPHPDVAL